METVKKLEVTMASWYKSVPHLPKEGRAWLAANVWWITLIGVIIGGIAILGLIFLTLLANVLFVGIAGPVGAVVGGVVLIGVLVSLVLGIISLILGGMAINPLKATQKKGWTLLFMVVLLDAVSVILSNLFDFNILGMIWGLLWAAVGGYFLFEIRDIFAGKETRGDRKKVPAHQK